MSRVPSQSGKSWKSGKMNLEFSSQGKIREFEKYPPNQGKIREFCFLHEYSFQYSL
jgi:hypothetical protein